MSRKRLKNLSSKQKASTLILIAVLVVASILSAYFKISMFNSKGKDEFDVVQMNELQWKHIEDSLEIFTEDAQKNADESALIIKKKLQEKVSSGEFGEGFTKDEVNLKELSLLSAEVIQGKYLNNVMNDCNSLFVATKKGVISDLTLSHAVPLGRDRSWESEIERHYNKPLARQSVDALLKQSEGTIFWEFSNLACERHDSTESMTIYDLKQVYLSDGLDGLAHYNFLVASYIEKYGDILDSPDTTTRGEEVDNDKIIVVQRFNLADQIRNDKIKDRYLSTLIEKEKSFVRENEYELMRKTGLMMAVIGVFVVFSLSLMFYINAVVSRENK